MQTKLARNVRNWVAGLALAAAVLTGAVAQNAFAFQEPDNTKRNKAPGTTAGQQGASKVDTDMTKRIRQSINADKGLSTYAHNIKVVTKDGMVTLRGPVNSAEEKEALAAKATEIAGANNVKNQLEVKMKR